MYCIYRITNLVNGKTYIGQHKYKETPYDDYMGSGTHLKAAQKKYGIENFKKEIICKNVQYKATIDDMEKFYIKKEREQNLFGCYNIADGGEGCTYWRGKHRSLETRKKLSESLKGKPLSEKHKRKLKGRISPNKGKNISEEHKKKLAEVHIGKKISEEHKKKLHEAWKGKHHSEETKTKISEANKGRQVSSKTKQKLSEMYKGKHWKLVDGKRVWY